jgi:hypothetical protein
MGNVAREEESPKDVMHVENEAVDFLIKFKADDSDELRKDLIIDDVFKEAGFKEAGFTNLDKGLQEGIKKMKSKKWWGYPLDNNNAQLPDVTIFTNDSRDTVYCVTVKNGLYSWSRIEKDDGSYRVQEVNDESKIGEIADNVAFFEIRYRKLPVSNSRDRNNDIIIPVESSGIVATVRGKLGKL